MSFNFPSSPSINDTHAIPSGRVYTWDGTAWTLVGDKSSDPVHYVFTSPGAFPLRIPRAVSLIHVQMWGGGGAARSDYGGGGGGYMEGFLSREDVNFSPLSPTDFGTWGYVVVGAGGSGAIGFQGNPGGDSWIGPSDTNPATAWLRATGGRGANDTNAGAGGGPWIGDTQESALLRGVGVNNPASWWGGRGADGGNGLSSVFGGGGGGIDDGFPNRRGTSLYGGNGGDVTVGINGSARGGGGGAINGAGGRGEVRVTVFL